jgi:hypothetical protein
LQVGEPHVTVAAPSTTIPAFGAIQWPRAFRAAVIAGLAGALLMFTPIGAFGLGMLGGGFLAVALYRRNSLHNHPTPAIGARVGVLTGAAGFAFFSIFLAVQIAVFHTGNELRAALVRAVEQAASRSSDPEAQAVARWLQSPDGLTLMIALSLFFTLIVFLILATLGGTVGALVLRNKRQDF